MWINLIFYSHQCINVNLAEIRNGSTNTKMEMCIKYVFCIERNFMIIEYTYAQNDLNKRCYQCKWLTMIDDWAGHCDCPYNKVKFRDRQITDRKCTWKNADKRQ
jgi:hypothetical protein